MLITKKPHLVAFAGNPVRYTLSSEQGGGGGVDPIDGVATEVEITFNDIDDEVDHAIEISMLGKTRTFTLKSQADNVDHLPVADGTWDAERWALEIYGYLLNDKEIVENYDFSYDLTVIRLKAKTCSPDYDWTSGSNTITGITVETITNGLLPQTGTIDGVLIRVLKDGTIKLGEEFKPLMSDGTVKFNIHEYLHAYLLQLPPPRFKLFAQEYNRNVYTDFFLKFRAIFVDRIDGVFSARSYSDPQFIYNYALPGGLNRADLVDNLAGNVDFFGLAATKKKFLTWSPPSRITDKAETHSLFFAFQTPTIQSFQMKCRMYDDSTGQTISVTPDLLVQNWSVVEFMAGYTQLGLQSQMNGQVKRWELYLVDEADNLISDIREFVLDEEYHENTRYFRFRNSWGAYDSLRCTGIFENQVEHDREEVMFQDDEEESSYNAPGEYSIIKENESFSANSGWLTRDHLNYMRDFMMSADIYEVDETRLLKCMLTKKKTAMFKDKRYNYSLSFEYKRGWEDFFFQGLE